MTKEELIKFLKENLEIKIDTKSIDDFYRGIVGYEITASLLLDDVEIDSSSDSIYVK